MRDGEYTLFALRKQDEKCVSVNLGHDTTLFLEVVICFRMFLADI